MARISSASLRKEIELKISKDAEVQRGTRAFAEEVKTYWQDVAWPESAESGRWPDHPYATGGYRDSITVRQGRGLIGRFMSHFIVSTDHPNANFIENGTGPDKPGSRSPWGPYTPTPAFYPAARTAHHFGGTSP